MGNGVLFSMEPEKHHMLLNSNSPKNVQDLVTAELKRSDWISLHVLPLSIHMLQLSSNSSNTCMSGKLCELGFLHRPWTENT